MNVSHFNPASTSASNAIGSSLYNPGLSKLQNDPWSSVDNKVGSKVFAASPMGELDALYQPNLRVSCSNRFDRRLGRQRQKCPEAMDCSD